MDDSPSNPDKHSDNQHDKAQDYENKLPAAIKQILDDPEIPEDKKEALKSVIGISIERSSEFSGPLPPPEILEKYNAVIDNGAERIMTMAENQSAHRLQLEKQVVNSQIKQSGRGQWFGFIVGIVGLALATTLAILGYQVVATVFGSTTIVGLAAAFVIGKKMQHKDLEDKAGN